ncbi:3'-5' exoribonuclease YhaM family protein [Terriglobus aquaticus]|uniref:3'-5' exoribonuclease YhaM family protein n=1 Tax=Terriglobus aquaticus TaxID=940139 RepID=A0ABW9KR19_9BACT|nr:HD domain-containing protein [Terriglobus aquaticus]
MKDFFIHDAARHENAVITSYFLLASLSAREKKGGGQYLALTLADRTGSFDARMWEDFAEVLDNCSAGCYVKVQGRVERYNGRFQLSLQRMRNAAESEVDAGDFQPTSQYDVDVLWEELTGYVDAFANPYLQALVRAFLNDPELGPAFREAPAAKMLHHAWLGGLLEHVVFLVRLCLRVAPQYPDEVDPDLLVTAAILHDMGKVRELAWKRSFTYTTEGQLLGHITIGIGLVRDKAAAIPGFPDRLRVLVEHLILSHHGRFEFGSPKLPMTPEAVVFSALDDLEAKMQNMRAEFAKAVEAGRAADEVTDYSRSMERALLNSRAYLAGDPAARTAPAVEPELEAAQEGQVQPIEEEPAPCAEEGAAPPLDELPTPVHEGTAVADSTTEDPLQAATSEELITLFGAR